MTTTKQHDVAIIGGGPAGAAVAIHAAQAGFDVAVLERSTFPRFHVGESLVPAVNVALEKLGLRDAMDGRGFPRKYGVQFFSHRGPTRPFYFSEASDPRMHDTWQVLRSDFDKLMLDRAEHLGVKLYHETEAVDFTQVGDRVTGVVGSGPGSAEVALQAAVVVDASGESGLLARLLGKRTNIDGLQNSAVFCHYEGARRDPGIDAGSTLIFRLSHDSWLWFIPLPDTVSVGVVAPASKMSRFGNSATEILDHAIANSPLLAERLVDAKRTTIVRAARDRTYRAQVDGGPGWLLVGDALGFIDPIYSTGLFLTLLSAELAAAAISRELPGNGAAPDFAGFSSEYQGAFDQFLVLVQAFYREDFHFGQFVKNSEHRQGLVDLLTGNVGTPPALATTRAIAAQCDDKIPQ